MPFHGVNPSIRVYDYDVQGRKIITYKQHYLPLDTLYLGKENDDAKDDGDNNSSNTNRFGDKNSSNSDDASNSNLSDPELDRDEFLMNPKGSVAAGDRSSRNSKFMGNPPSNRKKRQGSSPGRQLGRGKGKPGYLNISGYKQCLKDDGKYSWCLPSNTPKGCKKSTLKKLKMLKSPPQKCKSVLQNQAEKEESSTLGVEPKVTQNLETETDAFFPQDKPQENTDMSNVDLKVSSKDDRMEQDNSDLLRTDDNDDFLVSKWEKAYDAAANFSVTEMTPDEMYKVYIDMKNDFNGRKFDSFRQQLVVLKQDFKCNETCHAYIICSITNMFQADVQDCLREREVEQPPKYVSQHSSTECDITGTPDNTPPVLNTTSKPEDIPPSTKQETNELTTANIESSMDKDTNESTTVYSETESNSIETPNPNVNGNTPHEPKSGGSGITVALVLIVFVILIAGAVLLYRRRYRWRNRQSDEFLLTDSVFKYDGYAQVDQPA